MATPLDQIESAALQLTPPERVRLAERLLLSLEEDDEILAAWADEAERRAATFERGEIKAAPLDDVLARARAGLSAAKGA